MAHTGRRNRCIGDGEGDTGNPPLRSCAVYLCFDHAGRGHSFAGRRKTPGVPSQMEQPGFESPLCAMNTIRNLSATICKYRQIRIGKRHWDWPGISGTAPGWIDRGSGGARVPIAECFDESLRCQLCRRSARSSENTSHRP